MNTWKLRKGHLSFICLSLCLCVCVCSVGNSSVTWRNLVQLRTEGIFFLIYDIPLLSFVYMSIYKQNGETFIDCIINQWCQFTLLYSITISVGGQDSLLRKEEFRPLISVLHCKSVRGSFSDILVLTDKSVLVAVFANASITSCFGPFVSVEKSIWAENQKFTFGPFFSENVRWPNIRCIPNI